MPRAYSLGTVIGAAAGLAVAGGVADLSRNLLPSVGLGDGGLLAGVGLIPL